MKYKNTTKSAVYLKDGMTTRCVSPGEEFDTEDLISVEGISITLVSIEKAVAAKPKKVTSKTKENLNVSDTKD
tara:strand:- start:3284 stop:3502 length:219 start_codon:yes stop_codon:yes gene_type:complete